MSQTRLPMVGATSDAVPATRDRIPQLPPSVQVLHWIATGYLFLFKRFAAVGVENLPLHGPVIVVCNHVKACDPVCIQVASRHRLIRFMQAREYYEQKPFHYLLRLLQVIPVNRNGNDTTSIRTALRVLADDGCLGIFPEGKISENGELNQARKGVALLALASNAAVIPAYIRSTPHASVLSDYLSFSRDTLHFGPRVALDDLHGRHRDEGVRELATQRIMRAITDLRDAQTAPADDVKGPTFP